MAEQEKEKASAEMAQETAETEALAEEAKETEAAELSEEAKDLGEEAKAQGPDEEAEEEEPVDEESEGDEEKEGEGKKSWAERRAEKKQAKQKTEAMKEQIDQLEDRVKRQLAEFENFRNRTEREKQAMFETGARSVIEKILPVVDNFERGLATVGPEKQDDPFVDGMNKVYKQLITELDNIGVKPIEAVGKEFDPSLHNAVMQVESEEYESGIVAQELQKGYTYRDTVVRHSMVSVVQ
ncbi:MAG: nucleotide exchange factor GrpE [Lachnospiraceae bacterium]|nr:nucleotide exchange factor GrpE [Lachnospiraceae bacterium]